MEPSKRTKRDSLKFYGIHGSKTLKLCNQLQPKTPLKYLPVFGLALISFFTAGCERQQAVALQAPPTVTVSRAIEHEVIEWDEYTGRIEAVEAVEVRARVSGYLESVHFRDGQVVQEGELLFVIDPRPYQVQLDRAEAEMELAKARLQLERNDYSRAQVLFEARAISEEEADTRASDLRVAKASVQSALAAVEAAALNLEFTRVTAPVSGRISRHFVSEGNLINGGSAQATLLTRIVSLDPIFCYFEADERSYLKYARLSREGKRPSSREAKNPVYLALADEEGFPHKGYMDFVDNRLDPNTGTMTGRAVLPNPDFLLTPGLFARIRVPGSGRYSALLLPDQAIGTDLSQKFVMVVGDQDLVEYRPVSLGPIIGGLRVVRSGLQPSDRVIIRGVQKARAGTKVNPQKGEIVFEADDFDSRPVS